jgi:hypothetical protein
MRRDELLGLLDSMTPIEQQRITAEIAVQPPPAELVIRFKQPTVLERRLLVIAGSFVLTCMVGFAALLL